MGQHYKVTLSAQSQASTHSNITADVKHQQPIKQMYSCLYFQDHTAHSQKIDYQDNHDRPPPSTHTQVLEATRVTLTSPGSNGQAVVKISPRNEEANGAPARKKRYPGEKWKSVAHRLNQLLCLFTMLVTVGFGMTIFGMYFNNSGHPDLGPV